MKPYPHSTDYLVSKDGRVYSTKRKGRWLVLNNDGKGYLCVGLSCAGKQKTVWVHRMVLETFVGDCPAGMQCRHLDGNSHNNNINNLCWGTSKENHSDRIRINGRWPKQVKNRSQVIFQNPPKRSIFDCETLKRFLGSRLPLKF